MTMMKWKQKQHIDDKKRQMHTIYYTMTAKIYLDMYLDSL